jgi:hypothetical protein
MFQLFDFFELFPSLYWFSWGIEIFLWVFVKIYYISLW